MRLPRRVPWAYIGELEQVCSWIYADGGDTNAKTLAINRLSAWKAVTPLPHALDSTLAILAAHMLDVSSRDALATITALSVRQTYAAAIIRMVNGLVDPLQSGAYARSIAAIATQLGLPSWLVELRHAATHENLPSLELLREACNESLTWLLQNYFHPTLSPSAPASTPSLSLRPFAPLLKSYKHLMKTVNRDGSLRRQLQAKIDSVMRDIERWISEAQVSAELAINPLGWRFDDDSADVKEKWALEMICNALLESGGIIPVSKRKCRAPADPFLPTAASLALWKPFLIQLYTSHASFPSIFISRVISTLLDDLMGSNLDVDIIELDSASLAKGAIHNEYLARWVTWAVGTWTDETGHGTDLKREVILQVAPIFIPGQDPKPETKILNELLQAIAADSKNLEECTTLLRTTGAVISTQLWQDHDLVDMEERLQLVTTNASHASERSDEGSTCWINATRPGVPTAGWKLLCDRSPWAPCPIAAFYLGIAVKLLNYIHTMTYSEIPPASANTMLDDCKNASEILPIL